MLDHLRLPEGTNIVAPPAVRDIAPAVDLAAAYGQTVVVHGGHGTGKYTAVKMALDVMGMPAFEFDLEPGMSSKAVVRRLHNALVGHDDVAERDLQDDVTEALAAAPRAVIVRHADRLTREAAGQLNWLHQHPACRFPLILVGGPAMGRALRAEAHLAGTVVQTVEVKPLTGREMLTTVQQLHLLLTGAGTELLTQIDKVVCHGVIRHWITFLTVALHIQSAAVASGKNVPVLSNELASATVYKMPTTINALSKP